LTGDLLKRGRSIGIILKGLAAMRARCSDVNVILMMLMRMMFGR
jgi:hypothetical protein